MSPPNKFEQSFLDEIRNKLPVSEIAARHVTLKKAGRELRGLSPFTKERTPSFFVNDQKRRWFDFAAGQNGDVFGLVMHTEGLSFADAVEACARYAGVPMPRDYKAAPMTSAERVERERRARATDDRRADERRRQEQSEAGIRRIAYRAWREGVSLTGTVGQAYLQSRGIWFGDVFKTLRFHGALEHRHPDTAAKSTWPAILAAVQAPFDDRFLAVWRIYLDGAGNKAPVASPKMGLGAYTMEGGAVRLGALAERSNVCEGIETGLGIFGLLGGREGVQAALSTSGMGAYIAPPHCRSTRIWPDGDTDRIKPEAAKIGERHMRPPGLVAAERLRDVNRNKGHPTKILSIPPRKIDWLDVWQHSKDSIDDGE